MGSCNTESELRVWEELVLLEDPNHIRFVAAVHAQELRVREENGGRPSWKWPVLQNYVVARGLLLEKQLLTNHFTGLLSLD